MDLDWGEQVRVTLPRRATPTTTAPTPSSTPTPQLRRASPFPDLGIYPNLKSDLDQGLQSFKGFLQRRQAGLLSLNKAREMLAKGEPPRSLIPNVEVHLPAGFELDAAVFEARKKQFALDTLMDIVSKREAHINTLSETTVHSFNFFDTAIKAFVDKAPTANKHILNLIGMDDLRAWWEHHSLLILSAHEAEELAKHRRDTEAAAQAQQAQVRAETAPAEQLIGDLVESKIKERLTPLLTQINTLINLVNNRANAGTPSPSLSAPASATPPTRNGGNARGRGRGNGGSGSTTGRLSATARPPSPRPPRPSPASRGTTSARPAHRRSQPPATGRKQQ